MQRLKHLLRSNVTAWTLIVILSVVGTFYATTITTKFLIAKLIKIFI